MNKAVGNMYAFLNADGWKGYTWNPIRGKCIHECAYCFVEDMANRYNRPQKPVHLAEDTLKDNLGEGNFIFVGSSIDMFAISTDFVWIEKVLTHCREYPKNRYLFQSKNPERMVGYSWAMPKNSVLGTTIETNRIGFNYNAPSIESRRLFIGASPYPRMVTIEPIMDFDLDIFVKLIRDIKPDWVNIGADSKGHRLPEPSPEKVKALIEELKKFTEVKLKDNLKRIIK